MKGIVLAGGTGSRLWPITWGVSKQLLPVYDKPLIHYPIATLMLANIREILVITNEDYLKVFKRVLGDGSRFGVRFSFRGQLNPDGIAQAFLIGEEFIGLDSCALILGDNIFYGAGLGAQLQRFQDVEGANIFAYKVKNPHRYGVVEIDDSGKPITLEEKPINPRSRFAIPGLYFYDNDVISIAKSITPSDRGELEITSVNKKYMELNRLSVTVLERGTAWLDTGTFDSLYDASAFIKVVEERQDQKVSCLEEIAWRRGWISDSELNQASEQYGNSPFGAYLKSLIE